MFGIRAAGPPQPRRLVLHQHWPRRLHPMRYESTEPPEMVPTPGRSRSSVEGAGVTRSRSAGARRAIEPGHFRFWVVGETILRMKARLWFSQRDRAALRGKGHRPQSRDSRADLGGHPLSASPAYCQGIEDAIHIRVPEERKTLRASCWSGAALQPHRRIGALCNDVGFGLAQAWALTLREQLLNLTRGHPGTGCCEVASCPVAPGSAACRLSPS